MELLEVFGMDHIHLAVVGVEVCTEDFIWHVGDIGYMDDSYAHSPVRQEEHYTFAARMDLGEDEWR